MTTATKTSYIIKDSSGDFQSNIYDSIKEAEESIIEDMYNDGDYMEIFEVVKVKKYRIDFVPTLKEIQD